MIENTQYLIVGASHAGLEALRSIRTSDKTGTVMLVSRDVALPYSPTVLPYVASGEVNPQQIFLCDDDYFKESGVRFLRDESLQKLDPESNVAILNSGLRVRYKKLLLATGSTPVVPLIDGLTKVRYHVLRTLQDANNLHVAAIRSRKVVILGGGTIGMRVAESLACAGLSVTVVEKQSHVLSGYFDHEAAILIEDLFARNGVSILRGSRAVSISNCDQGCELTLEGGEKLLADLLLVCSGAQPAIDYLAGTAIAKDCGIRVDERMRTNINNIWASGGCVQSCGFLDQGQRIHNSLPDAAEQGRLAGMDMAGILGSKRYRGGILFFSCDFFGSLIVSVGKTDDAGCEIHRLSNGTAGRYLNISLNNNRLIGMFAIDVQVDSNVMREFILRRIDLGPFKEQFLKRGRALISVH